MIYKTIKHLIGDIIIELQTRYYNYYSSVYYTYLEEAIENTLKDLGIVRYEEVSDELIEKIDKHIKENYI